MQCPVIYIFRQNHRSDPPVWTLGCCPTSGESRLQFVLLLVSTPLVAQLLFYLQYSPPEPSVLLVYLFNIHTAIYRPSDCPVRRPPGRDSNPGRRSRGRDADHYRPPHLLTRPAHYNYYLRAFFFTLGHSHNMFFT